MTPKQIKDGMSKGVWQPCCLTETDAVIEKVTGNVFILGCGETNNGYDSEVANCQAACTAVNNTYNLDIDPEKLPDMVKMLNEISAWVSMNVAPDAKQVRDMKQDIDNLLTAAKIQ